MRANRADTGVLQAMGKLLIITGLLFIAIGIMVSILPAGGWPKLPGDIHIRGEDYVLYFPLGWCVLLSVLASLAWWLFGR